MSEHDDIGENAGGKTLVAEYVLGLLDSQQHERVRAAIEADPRLAREGAFWRARFAALDNEFVEAAPPAHVADAIEARLFGTPEAEARRGGLWESLAFWRGLAAGALAVAVVAAGFSLVNMRPQSSADLAVELVAALEAEGTNVKFLAFYDSTTGALRLTGLSGEAGPNQDFELWAIQGENAAPVSMGVIEAKTHNVLTMTPQVAEDWGAGSMLAISVEPEGGSPTSGPTGPIVAQGMAMPI
jgi:anti-sigma-K factor RskA